MLTSIREKAQGVFAWGILLAIGVPFALWGINNYTDNFGETPVASVGNKDFYQRDVNKAYEQFSQSLRGLAIDEKVMKSQALQKLIRDEVLLQYARNRGLVATDDSAREFVKGMEYFQTDGHYDDSKYRALLANQNISSSEFASRVKNALIMEQFQASLVNTGFAGDYDVQDFFRIQNQQRDFDYVSVPLQAPAQPPSDEEINAYFQQHQNDFQTPEMMSVEYVELSLADLAKKIDVSDEKLRAFYEEQKEVYTVPERRKISHMLFSVNSQTTDAAALEKAKQAKLALAGKDFAKLAEEVSDDKASAKQGGDLGLFNAGVMEKSFEVAATALKLGEVSEPVKTAFGYHLIKVTEWVPAQVKSYESVKNEVKTAYQKAQADKEFYETGEKLAELAYQNPDNLQAAAGQLGLAIQKTPLFTKEKGEGIAADAKIRSAAFSDEVLRGSNSAPVEAGAESLVVLRLLEHKPSAVQDLAAVKMEISDILQKTKAKELALEKAKAVKQALLSGEAIAVTAGKFQLEVKSETGLTRRKSTLPQPITQAVFKAAKPLANKPVILLVGLPTGEQVVISLAKVTEGVMGEDDKKQLALAKKNIGNLFGESEYNAFLESLKASADIDIKVLATNNEQQ